jgi:hypothetical protein
MLQDRVEEQAAGGVEARPIVGTTWES